MGVEEVVIVGLVCMVLVVGAIGGAFYVGRGYSEPLIDALEARIKTLEATLTAERARTARQAREAQAAFRRALARHSVGPDPDGERMLRAIYGDEPSDAPGERAGEDDEGGDALA